MSGHLTEEQYKSQVAAVWKSTLWLSIITVVEVVIALTLGHLIPKFILNLFFVLASVLKAFFIIAEFMHLKYEKRAFIISLGVPLIFLVWALIAFVVEGNYWLHLNFSK
ncbi:MAG TPA: cytochrome C oxidase subunit IV family protein [Chitinophagales bacterium]|jgi:cytochrome c oxidase subunit IV|nr:cytochrome C oxidase subunit IV family protein [Chitinophagales bacterium]